MKKHWRLLLALLPKKIERNFYDKYFQKEHSDRLNSSSLLVSNLSKHNALKNLSKEYNIKTLVETGTYLGDTLYALYNYFEKLYSIELSETFYNKALKRFKSFKKIKLIYGDSGKLLQKLMPDLKEPSLFWLDGHYSGGLTAKGDKECPVYEELTNIFSSPLRHVIVIDDARLFNGENSYPSLEELKDFVNKIKPGYQFSIENDSIRLLP